jgi:hypothetical protein
MQHHHAVLGEQRGAFLEKSVVEADADMLEHPDRDDTVEGALDIPVVGEPEIDLGSEPAFAGPRLRRLELLARQGDPGHLRAAELGEIVRKTAPPGADVEDAVAGAGAELRRQMSFFGELGIIQGLGRRLEIGAAVLAVGIEEQRIETVVEIVVVGDIVARVGA